MIMSTAVYENYIKAGNPDAPAKELRTLWNDQSANVRRRIASNPATPKDVLRMLASDADEDVRIAVGRNRSTPRHVVRSLAKDNSANVRYGLAGDRSVPIDVIEKLAEDENAYVMDQAQRTLEGIALEEALKQANFIHEPGDQARLGDLLVESGLLRAEELKKYLSLSLELGLPLGHTMARAKALPRATIVISLQLQLLVRRKQIELQEAINLLKLRAQNKVMPYNYTN